MSPERNPLDAAPCHICPDGGQIPITRNAIRATHVSGFLNKATRAYIVFAVVTSLYLVPFMRVMLPHSNEGTLIYGAERIVRGDVFARDFFEVMGPGSFYIVALFFKTLGETFLSTRVWLFCSSFGIAFCLYFLARRVCPRNAMLPCLLVAGTWFGMQWPSVNHHVDSDLFSLLSVVCLVIWEERGHSAMLYLAGICAGVTVWIHQPKGFMLIVALLIWCACRAVPRNRVVATAGRVLVGFLAVNLLAGGYFVSHGALGSLIYANVIWPARNYTSLNAVPYALGIFSEYWHHWAALVGHTGWPIVFATILVVPFVFVAMIPGLLLLSAGGVKPSREAPVILLCLLTGWAVWLSEVHRMDIYHLAFGCPLLLVACINILGRYEGRIIRLLLQCLSISAVCLMVSNLLQAATARTIVTRAGTVAMLRPDPVVQFIDAHTTPGEQAFFYPYCPGLYFLSQTTNPTRFSILVYNYNTEAEFQEVIQTLEQRHVRFVVWDSTFYDRTFKAVFPGNSPVPERAQVLELYFRLRYRQIADLDGFRILLRKE